MYRIWSGALIFISIYKFVVHSSPVPSENVTNIFRPNRFSESPKRGVQEGEGPEEMKPVGCFSVLKTHAKIYTNINGKEKEVAHTKEEVDKDGSVLAKVEQRIDKTDESGRPRITTSLEIPSQNIHKVIHNRLLPPAVDLKAEGPAGFQYSPADIADYIFWTGDERGVTSAIEEYLKEGIMSRNDAIDFLQEIKKNLEEIQNRFSDSGDLTKVS